MNKKFGVQLYTLRNFLNSADEIAETFAKIKNMGYDNIQTHCALKNYDNFARLAQKAGLEICGTFDDFEMMLNNPSCSPILSNTMSVWKAGIAWGVPLPRP